jgi:hypothetical protein
MKSLWGKRSRNLFLAIIAAGVAWPASPAMAQATPESTPRPQIDGIGIVNTATSRRTKPVQFLISGVANEQATPDSLAGDFFYQDRKSHVTLISRTIETVTINGDQGAFTGTGRIGGPRNKQIVQFTVMVTANQDKPSEHTFSIVLSNGYAASGNLRAGEIVIHDVEPD